MPTAWIVTRTNPQLVEALESAGWEVESFAPGDLVPASHARVPDPDAIILEIGDAQFLTEFREARHMLFAPVLAVVPNWTFADPVVEDGADEVMIAPVNPIELLWRAGRLVRAAKIVRVGGLAIDLAAQTVKRSGCVVRLSSIEFRLLACLAEHIGQVVSHDDILLYVWKYHPKWGGALEQVKSCVKRVRQKIDPDPHDPQYIVSIRRVGYQLRNQAQWEAAVRES